MLRSLIAHFILLLSVAAINSTSCRSVQAEMPLEAWLMVAADSFDQQIDLQNQSAWQSLKLIGQQADKSFQRLLDQCRMGVAGNRGLQFVRATELLAELRDSGVAGVVSRRKNWNFPAENFELQHFPQAKANEKFSPTVAVAPLELAVIRSVPSLASRGRIESRQIHNAVASLANATRSTTDHFQETILFSARPMISTCSQTVEQTMNRLKAIYDDPIAVVLRDSEQTPTAKHARYDYSKRFYNGVLAGCLLEASHAIERKLEWFNSKIQNIVESCLRQIQPQFLNLEITPMA